MNKQGRTSEVEREDPSRTRGVEPDAGDRDIEGERLAVVRAAARFAGAADPPTAPAQLLALQGALGNHAVQRMLAPSEGAVDAAAAERRALAQRGGGAPLPALVRQRVEGILDCDLGDVRIHTDDTAAALASGLDARAFTVGHEVSFGSGEFDPHDSDRFQLLVHELTHVRQHQRGQRPDLVPGHAIGRPGGALEREAAAPTPGRPYSPAAADRPRVRGPALAPVIMRAAKGDVETDQIKVIPDPASGKLRVVRVNKKGEIVAGLAELTPPKGETLDPAKVAAEFKGKDYIADRTTDYRVVVPKHWRAATNPQRRVELQVDDTAEVRAEALAKARQSVLSYLEERMPELLPLYPFPSMLDEQQVASFLNSDGYRGWQAGKRAQEVTRQDTLDFIAERMPEIANLYAWPNVPDESALARLSASKEFRNWQETRRAGQHRERVDQENAVYQQLLYRQTGMILAPAEARAVFERGGNRPDLTDWERKTAVGPGGLPNEVRNERGELIGYRRVRFAQKGLGGGVGMMTEEIVDRDGKQLDSRETVVLTPGTALGQEVVRMLPFVGNGINLAEGAFGVSIDLRDLYSEHGRSLSDGERLDRIISVVPEGDTLRLTLESGTGVSMSGKDLDHYFDPSAEARLLTRDERIGKGFMAAPMVLMSLLGIRGRLASLESGINRLEAGISRFRTGVELRGLASQGLPGDLNPGSLLHDPRPAVTLHQGPGARPSLHVGDGPGSVHAPGQHPTIQPTALGDTSIQSGPVLPVEAAGAPPVPPGKPPRPPAASAPKPPPSPAGGPAGRATGELVDRIDELVDLSATPQAPARAPDIHAAPVDIPDELLDRAREAARAQAVDRILDQVDAPRTNASAAPEPITATPGIDYSIPDELLGPRASSNAGGPKPSTPPPPGGASVQASVAPGEVRPTGDGGLKQQPGPAVLELLEEPSPAPVHSVDALLDRVEVPAQTAQSAAAGPIVADPGFDYSVPDELLGNPAARHGHGGTGSPAAHTAAAAGGSGSDAPRGRTGASDGAATATRSPPPGHTGPLQPAQALQSPTNPPGASPPTAPGANPTPVVQPPVWDGRKVTINLTEGAGSLEAGYSSKSNQLTIYNYQVAAGHQGQGLSDKLVGAAVAAAGQVDLVTGYMAGTNLAVIHATGDIRQTPWAKTMERLGFTEHSYDPGSHMLTSRRPRGGGGSGAPPAAAASPGNAPGVGRSEPPRGQRQQQMQQPGQRLPRSIPEPDPNVETPRGQRQQQHQQQQSGPRARRPIPGDDRVVDPRRDERAAAPSADDPGRARRSEAEEAGDAFRRAIEQLAPPEPKANRGRPAGKQPERAVDPGPPRTKEEKPVRASASESRSRPTPRSLTATARAELDAKIAAACKRSPYLSKQVEVERSTILDYIEDLTAGKPLPPIIVVNNELLDGHHRYIASQITGKPIDVSTPAASPMRQLSEAAREMSRKIAEAFGTVPAKPTKPLRPIKNADFVIVD